MPGAKRLDCLKIGENDISIYEEKGARGKNVGKH